MLWPTHTVGFWWLSGKLSVHLSYVTGLLVSGMIGPYMISSTCTFNIAAVASWCMAIVSKHGLRIEMHYKNQPIKTKLVLYIELFLKIHK